MDDLRRMWYKDWLVSWWIWNQHSPDWNWAGDWFCSKKVTPFHRNHTTSLLEKKLPSSKIKTHLNRRGASALSRRYSEFLSIHFFHEFVIVFPVFLSNSLSWAGDWIRSKSDQVTLFHHNLTTSLFERKLPYSKIKTYLKRRGASALSRRYSESLDIYFFYKFLSVFPVFLSNSFIKDCLSSVENLRESLNLSQLSYEVLRT